MLSPGEIFSEPIRGGAVTVLSEIPYLLCQKHRRFLRHKMSACFGNDTLEMVSLWRHGLE